MKKYLILIIGLSLISAVSFYFYKAGHNSLIPSYPFIITGLLAGMVIILGGCELFANGVECIGSRYNLSHATAGSLLAAVGTALPETMVPVIALIAGKTEHREGIAVGAILGAPFMLTTLAMFLLGVTVIIRKILRRRDQTLLTVNQSALLFELKFFMVIMTAVLIASLIKVKILNHILGLILFISYGLFIYFTMKHESIEGEEYTEHFHFGMFLGCPRRLRWIAGQVLVGLFFIVAGAHLFVEYISLFAIKSGIPALVLSLLITPLATELPEKFNSITWTIKGKDTIAMANISGALVFQSTIPVGIGLIFTEWNINNTELLNITFALGMASIVTLFVSLRKKLPGLLLLSGGIFYLIYIVKAVS
ncbi:MAG: sodium:calcium antiporter [Thermodesulfovibrionales bacterium]|nr:sodium:calcium antiporter [Thermodesulfovibrionales bacterium]